MLVEFRSLKQPRRKNLCRGAKDFVGSFASHFGSVVTTCSGDQSGPIRAMFLASKMAARAFSRYCKAQCSISVILLAVIYYPASAGHTQNVDLYSHTSSNVDISMQSHPDALVLVTGDFNYRSTGFSAKFIQRSTGLFQLVDVPTRDNVTLDWCLTNCNNLFKSVQLPPLSLVFITT